MMQSSVNKFLKAPQIAGGFLAKDGSTLTGAVFSRREQNNPGSLWRAISQLSTHTNTGGVNQVKYEQTSSPLLLKKKEAKLSSRHCFSSSSKIPHLISTKGHHDVKLFNTKKFFPSQTSCRSIHLSTKLNATATDLSLESGPQNAQSLRIDSRGRSVVIPALWLRDHCRSPEYYNHETHQKNIDSDLLTRDLTIDCVESTHNNSGIKIIWTDSHVSEYSVDWLLSNYYQDEARPGTGRLLWDRETIEAQPLPVVPYDDHMTLEAGLARTVSNLCKYGFAVVEGAEASVSSTQSVVERLTFIKETLFGKMWTFTADASRSDTSYSTVALGSHTDMTYMDTPAGIQVFHCLKHTGTGGETLLVDGFHAMEVLRQSHPEDFDLLSSTVVPHEYKEEPSPASQGYHLYSLGTVIRAHPASGELIQLRFNPYDRAPLNTVAPEDIPPFYTAYGRLVNIIADPVGQFWLKLRPGQVLFIDNWRVMHGRAAFDGTRVMCGCYLPREEWVSKARMLGVW